MKTRYVILLTVFAATIAATSPLVSQQRDNTIAQPPGGMLRTLPQGTYQCALPGDVTGKAFKVVAEEEFKIGAASSYTSADGKGTYILRGDQLTFTRGPKKDERFERVGTNQLRKIENGSVTKLLCTRLGTSNQS